jgi:hypothetical protein
MLISEDYRQQNAHLIKTNPKYAISGKAARHRVRHMSDWGRKEILDYGCGRALLAQGLGPAYRVHNYDPCVEEYSADPIPKPVVYCGDVLEHIEPECLDHVLAHLREMVIDVGYFRIAVKPSHTTLPDGRNAHLIIQPHGWWRERLIGAGFEIIDEKPLEEIDGITWFVVK